VTAATRIYYTKEPRMSSFSAERSSTDPKMTSPRESFSHVKEDLNRLKDDAIETASATAQAAKHTARKGVEQARDYAKQGVDTAGDYAQQANDYAMDAYDGACEFVRERPATAMLIALGVGAVLSRMLISRR